MSMETPIKRFRPERPIYISKDNTGLKSEAEVMLAVEKLRSAGWLTVYSADKIRPFHLSFNVDSDFQEFKKSAQSLGIKLIAPPITNDMIEELDFQEKTTSSIKEPKKSFEDSTGKIHIE